MRIAPDTPTVPFICECPLPACMSVEKLAVSEYELVRSQGEWFFVVIGHEVCLVEGEEVARVARKESHFSIMEKVGLAGKVARDLDPRA